MLAEETLEEKEEGSFYRSPEAKPDAPGPLAQPCATTRARRVCKRQPVSGARERQTRAPRLCVRRLCAATRARRL